MGLRLALQELYSEVLFILAKWGGVTVEFFWCCPLKHFLCWNRLREIFSSYPPFLRHVLLRNMQETSFQGKTQTEVGNMSLVYKQLKWVVMDGRPIWGAHQATLEEDGMWQLQCSGWPEVTPPLFTVWTGRASAHTGKKALGEPRAMNWASDTGFSKARFSKITLVQLLLMWKQSLALQSWGK